MKRKLCSDEIKDLKNQLNYNANTGKFYWKIVKPRSRYSIGDDAGCLNKNNKYVQIRINQKTYLAHRLAYMFVYGVIPEEVDHINHDRADNRIENLRSSNRCMNSRNLKDYKGTDMFAISITPFKKFRVRPRFNNKNYDLGTYDSVDIARYIRNKFYKEKGFHNEHSSK